jgi:N-methylhydantoinase A/acetophenone carboxylase
LIEELDEEIDSNGKIVKPLERDEVLERMQRLIDMGARAIAVSLRNSHANSSHEKKLKGIVKEQYPNFYLGSVRVFLASEMSELPGDFCRTNTVVVNGYIHDVLVKYLYKAEDDLRSNFCAHPLMVAHSHGGVARVAKTRAIDTYASGPVLGVIGAGNLGTTYGFSNVITIDIGGTSLDIGLIRDGIHTYSSNPLIAGLPVSMKMIATYSAPIASGTIARVDLSKELQVGPKSAGARPGPACFDLGGSEPTVTDADVILGFIDPDYFLGGRIKLNKTKAEKVMKTKIADRLGLSVNEAAWMVRDKMARMSTKEILDFAGSYGINPEDLSKFAVVVYGGAGPTHYGDFMKDVRFGHSLATPYASVFSAFGSSTTDLLHSYSKFMPITLKKADAYFSDYEGFNKVIGDLKAAAERDIRGEGFSPDKAVYSLELEADGDLKGMKVNTDVVELRSEGDVKKLCAAFAANGSISLSSIVLSASIPMPHLASKKLKMAGKNPSGAVKGSRPVFWSPASGYKDTPIYELERLVPGNTIDGPAVVEAKDTTYVVPEGIALHVDQYGNAIMIKG